MRITLEMLKAHKACKNQYKLFAELFADGVEITEELCAKHAQDFDFEWAARHLLSPLMWKAYDEATAPHRKAYEEATAAHRKAYEQAIAAHRKALDEATAPHWKAYDEAIASHRKTFSEALAREFFHASQL